MLVEAIQGRAPELGDPEDFCENLSVTRDAASCYGIEHLWTIYTEMVAFQLVNPSPFLSLMIAFDFFEAGMLFDIMLRIPDNTLETTGLWDHEMLVLCDLRLFSVLNTTCVRYQSEILKDERYIDGRKLAKHFPWEDAFWASIDDEFMYKVRNL